MKFIVLLLSAILFLACDKKRETSKETNEISTEIKIPYSELGMEYATTTQKILGKNLMEKIQQGGANEALAFCNIQAIPLTDSMAVKYNATIKRVSDKNRNSSNQANPEELKYIKKFKTNLLSDNDLELLVVEKEDKVHFYYPITTNAMCLQCHGKPQNIKPEVMLNINKLYPNDLATGYSENEVRGIWSIAFDK